ncbi:hypothetical protein N7494_005463 [Penicillium frequentans]|uniref:Uncharacterized protein n=1 Tax=Penicillium frequentans TaxID=3151616 RepID=A0AAD6D0B4_9EURO|nr:hypothetical protein N7494_005463 [Penicillium glabrum]
MLVEMQGVTVAKDHNQPSWLEHGEIIPTGVVTGQADHAAIYMANRLYLAKPILLVTGSESIGD